MVVRKCPKCGVVWRSELTQCAFCGHEGADQPATAVTVLERPANGKSLPAALPPVRFEPAEASAPPPPVKTGPNSIAAAPAKADPVIVPADVADPRPAEAAARSADAKAGPAPNLPSANVPLVFAFLGLAAAALLPFGAWMTPGRTASVLVFLGVALLAPFAPLAWWTGGRYEESCDVLGFLPSGAARAGRGMGVAVTLLLAAEGSALAFLRALQGLQG